MSTPVVKHRGRGTILEPGATVAKGKATNGVAVTLQPSDTCPRCVKGHLMSDHVEEKMRQCNLCACIAQDTDTP